MRVRARAAHYMPRFAFLAGRPFLGLARWGARDRDQLKIEFPQQLHLSAVERNVFQTAYIQHGTHTNTHERNNSRKRQEVDANPRASELYSEPGIECNLLLLLSVMTGRRTESRRRQTGPGG